MVECLSFISIAMVGQNEECGVDHQLHTSHDACAITAMRKTRITEARRYEGDEEGMKSVVEILVDRGMSGVELGGEAAGGGIVTEVVESGKQRCKWRQRRLALRMVQLLVLHQHSTHLPPHKIEFVAIHPDLVR